MTPTKFDKSLDRHHRPLTAEVNRQIIYKKNSYIVPTLYAKQTMERYGATQLVTTTSCIAGPGHVIGADLRRNGLTLISKCYRVCGRVAMYLHSVI